MKRSLPSEDDAKKRVQAALSRPENQKCADCLAKDPRWASSTLGVFLCINCSGRHRNLGTHITFVRSTTLDSWTSEQADLMERVGNERANAYWEANLPSDYPRPKTDDLEGLTKFIKFKYELKKWADKNSNPPHIGDKKKKKKVHRSESQSDLNSLESSSQMPRSSSVHVMKDTNSVQQPANLPNTASSRYSAPDDLFSLLDSPSNQPNFSSPQQQTPFQPNKNFSSNPTPFQPNGNQNYQQNTILVPQQKYSSQNGMVQTPPQSDFRNSIKSLLTTSETAPKLVKNTAAFRGTSDLNPSIPINTFQPPVVKVQQPSSGLQIIRGPDAPVQQRSKDPFSNISPF